MLTSQLDAKSLMGCNRCAYLLTLSSCEACDDAMPAAHCRLRLPGSTFGLQLPSVTSPPSSVRRAHCSARQQLSSSLTQAALFEFIDWLFPAKSSIIAAELHHTSIERSSNCAAASLPPAPVQPTPENSARAVLLSRPMIRSPILA